jgi:TfoX/Sxy family transcriptional regulator of competence genes
MPYSESLADRVRQVFGRRRGLTEKKMFGGVGFLLSGNMCVGIWQTSLIARIGPTAYQQALAQPHVGEFDITGRPMAGWVLIAEDGLDDDAALRGWVEMAVDFVRELPAK